MSPGDEPDRSNPSTTQVRRFKGQRDVAAAAKHALGSGVGVSNRRERLESTVLRVFTGLGQLHVGLRSDSIPLIGEAERETHP